MKKQILFLVILFFGVIGAQIPLNRNYPVKKGEKISLSFDYPSLIKITTWNKNEVEITGSVNINNGKNNDVFHLTSTNSGNTLNIEGKITDLKDIPEQITVTSGSNKQNSVSLEGDEKYVSQGKNPNISQKSREIQIILEIKVPADTETQLDSVYGVVEVKNFSGPIVVNAPYGGIDADVSGRAMGNFLAETSYGQIYYSPDFKFSNTQIEDFKTKVAVGRTEESHSRFISTYGNIYLRK